mgnify:CR=1 FL=1
MRPPGGVLMHVARACIHCAFRHSLEPIGISMTTSFSRLFRALFTMLALALSACGSEQTDRNSPATVEAESTHAASEAVPGSYDDWCGEHQVPESKCTRCNPKLIPPFKATKDWCEEHSLPESQCTKCNPDVKIVRPPEGT